MQEIRKFFPLLEQKKNNMLAKRWVTEQDTKAGTTIWSPPHLKARGENRHGVSRLRPAASGRVIFRSERRFMQAVKAV